MCTQQEKLVYDNRIKRKNILALNEKIAAIRYYERNPSYKSVGRHFNCSPDQIKRVILQKSELIKAWNMRTRKPCDMQVQEMKCVEVSMLGKAVFEWIKRMMYYKDFTITDGLLQKMALQFKSIIGLQSFFPHQQWVDDFRMAYDVFEMDTKKLKFGCTEGFSVQLKDIIRDIIKCPDILAASTKENKFPKELTEAATPKIVKKVVPANATTAAAARTIPTKLVAVAPKEGAITRPPFTMTVIPLTSVSSSIRQDLKNKQKQTISEIIPSYTIKQEVEIKSEVVSDEEGFETDLMKVDQVNEEEVCEDFAKEQKPQLTNSAEPDNFNVLRDTTEARKCLKLLEDFALLKENFRLIGLLTRADEVLREMDSHEDKE